MIKSFKCKETEKIFNGEFSKKLPIDLHVKAFNKLNLIDVSESINDLRKPPSNHLEKLSGDRVGQYSLRINNKYRICFKWLDNSAFNVEIADYH